MNEAAGVRAARPQPAADTVKLTGEIESALAELKQGLTPGLAAPKVLFRQADLASGPPLALLCLGATGERAGCKNAANERDEISRCS